MAGVVGQAGFWSGRWDAGSGSAVFLLQAVEFLSKAVDSPNIKAVDEAVILLQEIGEWAGPAGLQSGCQGWA